MKQVNFPYFFVILLLAGTTSCDKFEGEITVPSYIRIDTIYLTHNPLLEEGMLTHSFTDVWVYVDDQMIGVFELPATVPVLASGESKVSMYAGIKFNAMSGTRGIYPFIRPKVVTNMELITDSTITRNPSVSYYDNTNFDWMEDFEGVVPSLIPTSNSDTGIVNVVINPPVEMHGLKAGVGYLDNTHTVFEVTTYDEENDGFVFPEGGSPVFLEMEYKTDVSLIVGVFAYQVGIGIQQHGILVLVPSPASWKKVYVNLTPSIDYYSSANFFNLFFRANRESSEEVETVMLDNLKLIYRNTK